METIYNRYRLKLYEKRSRAGKRLASQSQLVSDRHRQTGKILKVASFPQGGKRVPSVRVAGKWLERLGFQLGDEVILTASKGQVSIIKKEDSDYGSSLV